MKWLSGVVSASVIHYAAAARMEKNTVSKVIGMLENMQAESKKEAKKDRTLHAKFTCYCDTNTEKTTASIKAGEATIADLNASIEQLRGSTGKLSMEVAQLTTDIADTEQAIAEAEKIRKDQNEAFLAEEADLEGALKQMDAAIATLSDVGADLTADSRDQAGHEKFTRGTRAGFMQSRSMVKLGSTMKQALRAASALVFNKEHRRTLLNFLQEPVYSAQSGQVTGILKNMRDTFQENLENARATEAKQAKAHEAFLETKNASLKQMNELLEKKNGELGANDEQLASDREDLKNAQTTLADDQDFLATLTADCELKTKEYEERKMTRSQEDAALSEAIAILSSDDAFDTFNTAGRTSNSAFVQIKNVSKKSQVVKSLLAASKAAKSLRLAQFANLATKTNAFDLLFAEIDKLIENIKAEEEADHKKHAWCDKEQTENRDKVKSLNKEINALDMRIEELNTQIDNCHSTIAQTNADLEDNATSQKDATQERAETKAAFEANVSNLNASHNLLEKATQVLQKFYEDKLNERKDAGIALVQRPAAPEVGSFSDRNSGDNKVIALLTTIIGEIADEKSQAETDEKESIAAYDNQMKELKATQESLEKTLADTEMELSEATTTLANKEQELADTKTELLQTENYLAEILPGCTYIQKNIDTRDANRATETAALKNAKKQLKGTPAYQSLKHDEAQAALGDCKDTCNANGEEHAECKACLNKVSVPAYCTSNPDTMGCGP